MSAQASKSAVSFDAIIQADRNRRKHEALANEIFGRTKNNKSSGNHANKPSNRTPDLASRITKQTKRSSSVASTGSPRSNPFNTPSRPSSTNPRNARQNRVAQALNNQQVNIVSSQSQSESKDRGLSIKGKAGPFVVEASNFARGTTVADIESSLQHEFLDSNGASGLISCQLTQVTPYVVAEMIFTEKIIADRIVSTYDKQKADGRILHLKLKPVASSTTTVTAVKPIELIQSDPSPPAPVASAVNDDAMEDIEIDQQAATSEIYDAREGPDTREVDTDGQDGRYGPGDDASSRRTEDSRRDRDRDRNYDRERERDRERDGPRERERDRDRDRERERDRDRYDSRDDRDRTSSYRQDVRQPSYNSRTSHYGNGVGGVSGQFPSAGRGTYGGYRGGPSGGFGTDNVRGGGPRRGDPRGGGGGGYGGGYRRGY